MLNQLILIGAKGIGFQNLSAGLEVASVDTFNRLWVGEVELIKAAIEAETLIVEHGSHGAVEQNGCVVSQPLFDLVSVHFFSQSNRHTQSTERRANIRLSDHLLGALASAIRAVC